MSDQTQQDVDEGDALAMAAEWRRIGEATNEALVKSLDERNSVRVRNFYDRRISALAVERDVVRKHVRLLVPLYPCTQHRRAQWVSLRILYKSYARRQERIGALTASFGRLMREIPGASLREKDRELRLHLLLHDSMPDVDADCPSDVGEDDVEPANTDDLFTAPTEDDIYAQHADDEHESQRADAAIAAFDNNNNNNDDDDCMVVDESAPRALAAASVGVGPPEAEAEAAAVQVFDQYTLPLPPLDVDSDGDELGPAATAAAADDDGVIAEIERELEEDDALHLLNRTTQRAMSLRLRELADRLDERDAKRQRYAPRDD